MKTTSVTGTIGTEPAELIWQDGKVTGSPMALGLLLAARGEQYAGPQWPGVADVDVTRHFGLRRHGDLRSLTRTR